eukprot:152980-Amphidinium_carterae.1
MEVLLASMRLCLVDLRPWLECIVTNADHDTYTFLVSSNSLFTPLSVVVACYFLMSAKVS